MVSVTQVISYCLLALLALFFVKSGYPALITIEIVQLIYMHIFLYTTPLPYMEYNFLNVLQYFHLTFLPSIFPALNLTEPTYALFSSDLSLLANSPLIVLFAFIMAAYLLLAVLSSKRFVSNKVIRRLFKSIRKTRMKYGIIHDAFWVTFLYAVFFSLLQFKLGSFSTTNGILNMLLSIVIFILFSAFTVYLLFLGHKYRHTPDKIPKKHAFLMLEPSSSPL